MKTQTVKVMGDLTDFTEKFIGKLTQKVTDTLFEDTPELTGHAETHWIPKIGSPIADPVSTKINVSKSHQDQGIAVVLTTYKLPQKVYITNPVAYISKLNDGSSTKAPKDFVQTAIAKAIKSVI